MTPPRSRPSALKLCVLVVTVAIATMLMGCPPSAQTALDLKNPATMQAVLNDAAQGVVVADDACAAVADQMLTHAAPGDLVAMQRASTLNKACNDAAHDARLALLAGQEVLDSWSDAREGEVACVALRALEALSSIGDLVKNADAKAALPTSVKRTYDTLTSLIIALVAPVCPVPTPKTSPSPAPSSSSSASPVALFVPVRG